LDAGYIPAPGGGFIKMPRIPDLNIAQIPGATILFSPHKELVIAIRSEESTLRL
jgi:hypothetical protein